MLKIIVCLLMIGVIQITLDARTQSFRIERVYVSSEFDSSYVLAMANQLLPPDRDVTQAKVECLLSQLRDSGLFDRIKTTWTYSGRGVRRLTLDCHPKFGRQGFVVSRISVIGLSDVNMEMFSKSVAEKGLRPGSRLLEFAYDELNDLVDDSIRKSVSADLVGKYGGSAWLTFSETAPGQIEIKVFATRPDCKD